MTTPTASDPLRIHSVPVKDIRVLPQVRDALDTKRIASLALSMERGGLIYPIKLRRLEDGTLVVVDGHYRLSAALKLGWAEISAFIDEGKPSEAAVIGVQLASAECRIELNAMERARGYDEFLRRSKGPAAELAALIGLSESQISKTRALIGIRDDLQALVSSGRLAPSVALELNHVTDPKRYEELLQKARAGELTRAELASTGKPHRHRRAMKPARRAECITVSLDHGCSLKVPCELSDVDQLLGMLNALAERVRQARGTAANMASLFKLLGKTAPD